MSSLLCSNCLPMTLGQCRPVSGVTRPITRLRVLHLLKVMPLHETVMLLGWMVFARKLVEDWGEGLG